MVLRAAEGDGAHTVAKREKRDLFAFENLLDDDFGAGGAKGAAKHRANRRLRLLQRGGDDDAFARRQAIGFDHDRRALGANEGERRLFVAEPVIGGGRNAELAAKILGEAFRAFELRRGAARPETADPCGLEIVDEAGDQRRLGTDDDEADDPRPAEIDSRAVVIEIERRPARRPSLSPRCPVR